MTRNIYYDKLSPELEDRIREDKERNVSSLYAFKDQNIVRRQPNRDKANIWRPAFVRDIEKILHSPYYNRYADKTQVFSFYKNDDISRRALHVQLVSRIARNIGRVLGLNEELIEAVSLGHDIGHTPFGHAGERFLDKQYYENTGRRFNHNVHSVRVLDGILNRNISLQVLDGILCHNGEFELREYRPSNMNEFAEFDSKYEQCYIDKESINQLIPCTLESCVVRISDMIAYLGKDRQDAQKAKLLKDDSVFTGKLIGTKNAHMVNNIVVNIIENSYGKDYIQMSDDYFEELKNAKRENYEFIYKNDVVDKMYRDNIEPLFEKVYNELLKQLKSKDEKSVVYRHHITFVEEQRGYYDSEFKYRETDPNQIVVDYIASMTDDYFVDLYSYLFPKEKSAIEYKSYFQ